MVAGSFSDPRRRGIAVFGVMMIHTLGWKKKTKILGTSNRQHDAFL